MTHLTDVEVVDWLDGTLPPARAAHLETCDACRTKATHLREAAARADAVEMPEPSPLFWEHFSQRVHEGVRDAAAERPSGWLGWAQNATLRWATAGAVLTLLLVSSVWWASAPPAERAVPHDATASIADAAADADLDAFDPATDEAWALVRSVADDVSWDDASWDDATADGLGVRPGSVEHAMAALTGDERSELVRLLQAEAKPPGA